MKMRWMVEYWHKYNILGIKGKSWIVLHPALESLAPEWRVEESPEVSHKMISSKWTPVLWAELERGVFSMDNKGFCEDHTANFQYLREPYKKDGKKVFKSTTLKDFKLNWGRFRLDIRKRFFCYKIGGTLENISQSGQLCVGLVCQLG